MLPPATCRFTLASVVMSSAHEPFQVPVHNPVSRGGRTPQELTKRYRPESYMRSSRAMSIAEVAPFCRAISSLVDSCRSAAETFRSMLERSYLAWWSGACRPSRVA
jgi:hypothetical protein